MKTKTILTVFSLAAFLFTSCQKDEMDQGIGAGNGGKEGAYISYYLKDTSIVTIGDGTDVADSDTKKYNYPDSLSITLIDESIK